MTRVVQRAQITGESITIRASAGAFKVLTVHEQNGVPTVWYETLEKPVIPVDVKFTIVPTGGSIPDHSIYVGTAFCGSSVWHVYQFPAV
jgi:hypothetical protein